MLLPDITEMQPEERQAAMRSMAINDLKTILEDLMRDNRQCERGARLDALTIYTLRSP